MFNYPQMFCIFVSFFPSIHPIGCVFIDLSPGIRARVKWPVLRYHGPSRNIFTSQNDVINSFASSITSFI